MPRPNLTTERRRKQKKSLKPYYHNTKINHVTLRKYRWRWWTFAASIKLLNRHLGLGLRRSNPADVCVAVYNVCPRRRRLPLDLDVAGTSLFRPCCDVFPLQLPQQPVQTVNGHSTLAIVVVHDHETSAFGYTHLADRRSDVITPTSGRQINYLCDRQTDVHFYVFLFVTLYCYPRRL